MQLLQLLLLPCALLSGTVDDPWADRVIEYVAINPNTGFDNPQNAVGAPRGATTSVPNNSSIVSLGTTGSHIVLGFDTPIEDDPLNPLGLDFIVYSNAFWVGGNPQNKFTEPALVEIQEDHNGNGIPDGTWYVMPGSRNFPQSVVPGGIAPPSPPMTGANPNLGDGDPSNDLDEYNWGYAELTPTQQEYLDNYLRPDDPEKVGLTPRSGGGDAFDIAWAVDADGNPAGLARFHFIRIWSFINDGSTPEIMAVADVAADVDSDGDGILDAYETRVSGTDPLRPESTVLALEIPREDGGSPAGAHLGTAADAQGNSITFYSSGTRTGARDYNCVVDILPGTDFGDTIPFVKLTGAFVEFQSSVADFQAAQIHDAVFTIVYGDAAVEGVYESTLNPWRHDGSGYTQGDITLLSIDRETNTVTFSSRYPGQFVLAGVQKSNAEGMPLRPAAGLLLFMLLCVVAQWAVRLNAEKSC